jgi:UDP-glucose 4-epimerase
VHVAGPHDDQASARDPLHTYRANVSGLVTLLEAMEDAGVQNLVFSSADVGTPSTGLATELTPAASASPYGQTKLIGEWLVAAQGRAAGLRHTALRYATAVGSANGRITDTSPHHLVPMIFDALEAGLAPHLQGGDHPTPDGTGLRDVLHVADVAEAHVAAALRLAAGDPVESVYTLGSGEGIPEREIMAAVAAVTGIDITPEVKDRTPGGPARTVADGTLAARDLGWAMRHSVQEMVASAWSARQAWGNRAQLVGGMR